MYYMVCDTCTSEYVGNVESKLNKQQMVAFRTLSAQQKLRDNMKTIYLDMDDVTADWVGYVNTALGATYLPSQQVHSADWNELRTYHQRMYRDLLPNQSFIPIFRRLVDPQRGGSYALAFLTALPHTDAAQWPYAPLDKIRWVDRYLIEMDTKVEIPVFLGPYAHQKYLHCKPGDILIDDRQSNCTEWEAAGGIAHMYKNADDCMTFLKENVRNF